MRKAVLLGIGECCEEAIDFFGVSSVHCIIQPHGLANKQCNNILTYSMGDFKKNYNSKGMAFFGDCACEFIICMESLWEIHEIGAKLEEIGICDYSILGDIKYRWANGDVFLLRDRRKILFERQSLLYLREMQLKYVLRHTSVCDVTPAVGTLRDTQLDRLRKTINFFKDNTSIMKPLAVAGTLIGAYRHKGFIPWDDDLDFALEISEYKAMISKYDEAGLYYRKINDKYVNRFGDICLNHKDDSKFIILDQGGYAVVVCGYDVDSNMESYFCTDIFPMYGWGKQITDDVFRNIIDEYVEQMINKDINENGVVIDNAIKYMEDNSVPISLAERVSFGIDYLANVQAERIGIGRRFYTWIWDIDRIFPFETMRFEGQEVCVPADVRCFLEKAYPDGKVMEYPNRVGVYTHYKERIFSDIY